MNTDQCFIAKDYLRAFDLKNLFHKHVVYYTHLHHHDSTEPLSSKDRHELSLKLDETMNEITLLVLKMKESKQTTKAAVKETKLAAFNATPHITKQIPASGTGVSVNAAQA